ncbi:cytochrome c oxidase subunit IVB [Ornithinibacillus sp. 4-3]|uniref:Cytochrome c oxidase subunit IVB n=1 Tax=Ornithinibacillus sp. 4-3 TaxID=3231488 RepID=A0AB39HTT0_9BACI
MTNQTDSFKKQQNKEEMKRMVISFALMILLTVIAFAVVAAGGIPSMFIVPVLLIMAAIQVAFQLYYFMHMKDKGHGMPATLMYGGIWAALLTLGGLLIISWW